MRHIVGRVNHPQTNGKVERFYGTVEQKLPLFDGGLDVLMEWYNEKKPHMSLSHDGRRYDTPQEAFWYKMSPERLLGYVEGWLWEVEP
jgi:putative transposase